MKIIINLDDAIILSDILCNDINYLEGDDKISDKKKVVSKIYRQIYEQSKKELINELGKI